MSVFWILGFGFLWLSVTGIKHHFDSRHYQTVDGRYYAELSHDLLEGREMKITGILNKQGKSFSPYPPGYPALLAAVDLVHPDLIVPHHIWLHAVLFLLLGLIWVRFLPSWPLILVFFTDTLLEVGTYNWSEFSFIICLITVALLLAKSKKDGTLFIWFLLLIALILSSMIRYAALCQMLVLSVLVTASFRTDRLRSLRLFRVMLGYGLFLVSFSVWEWWISGQVTGGDRYPNPDGIQELMRDLFTEFGNQLLIFKDYTGSSVFSFRAGLAAMAILSFFLFRHFKKQPAENTTDTLETAPSFEREVSVHLLLMGICYLLFMIPTRLYFYFAETFDLRLLGPGFSLLWLSFFTFLSGKTKKTPRLALFLFLGFALFFTLPKQPMFDAYQEKFWLRTGPVFPPR
ncbi:MAG TPA: hypothetical protein PLK63_15120 [Catalimonadaceae bacterium]|nr:hypothetical protein [Catalimonadaceae bacterium]